jgi:hypothetical protein
MWCATLIPPAQVGQIRRLQSEVSHGKSKRDFWEKKLKKKCWSDGSRGRSIA